LLSPEGLFLAQNALKIVCRPGSAVCPDPLGELTGLLLRKGRAGQGRRGWGAKGRGEEGRGRKGLGPAPIQIISGYATANGNANG